MERPPPVPDGPAPSLPPLPHDQAVIEVRKAIGKSADMLTKALDELAYDHPAQLSWNDVGTFCRCAEVFAADATNRCDAQRLAVEKADETVTLEIDLPSTPGTVTPPWTPRDKGGAS